MSALGYKKGRRNCILSAVVFYILIIGKALIEGIVYNEIITLVTSGFLTIYLFAVTIALFDGGLLEKVLVISLYHCIIAIVELVVCNLFSVLLQKNMEELLANDLNYYCCASVAKGVQSGLLYMLFGKKRYKNFQFLTKEKITIFCLLISAVIDIVILNCKMGKGENTILTFETIQFILLSYALVLSMILKKKDKDIHVFTKELARNPERKKLLQELAQFRHDYGFHGDMMLRLLEKEKYGELKEYMQSLFVMSEKSEECYTHPDSTIEILMNQLIRKAQDVQVLFTPTIQVEQFGMKREEICSLFHNLVSNGIEAAAQMPKGMATVSLRVKYEPEGYTLPFVKLTDRRIL